MSPIGSRLDDIETCPGLSQVVVSGLLEVSVTRLDVSVGLIMNLEPAAKSTLNTHFDFPPARET